MHRILAALAAIAILALSQPAFADPVSNAQPTTTCRINDFVDGIADRQFSDGLMIIKSSYGYLSGEEIMRQSQRLHDYTVPIFRKLARQQFIDDVKQLNEVNQTFVLLYDLTRSQPCVWLASDAGVIASAPLKIGKAWQPDGIWSGLNVIARSARRSPRKRAPDDQCSFPPPQDGEPIASLAQLSAERQALQQTADLILPPAIRSALAADSAGSRRLVVIGSGAIEKVPFAALPLGPGYVIDKYAIAMAPSLASIGFAPLSDFVAGLEPQRPLRKVSSVEGPLAPSAALVVADPDLSWDKNRCWPPLTKAGVEGAYAADKLGQPKVISGKLARFAVVSARLASGRDDLQLIYFASHGIADEVNPADGSFIALGDRHLTGAYIRTQRFVGHPLVVLSACETGLGKQLRGAVYGLVRAWQYAGVDQVVASLWDVSDVGTSYLMRHYVDSLSRRGAISWRSAQSQAEFALAEAMRQTKAKYPDPAIWGSFAYFGVPN
jgi:CHAT domain-containing protein